MVLKRAVTSKNLLSTTFLQLVLTLLANPADADAV